MKKAYLSFDILRRLGAKAISRLRREVPPPIEMVLIFRNRTSDDQFLVGTMLNQADYPLFLAEVVDRLTRGGAALSEQALISRATGEVMEIRDVKDEKN